MSAPAPERPTTATATVGALMLAHVAARESLLERAVAAVMQVLWLFRFGVVDEPTAFAEVSDVVRSARDDLREETSAYLAEVFAQYGEDYPPVLPAEDQFAVDDEFWAGLTEKFTQKVDDVRDDRPDSPLLDIEGDTTPGPGTSRPIADMWDDLVEAAPEAESGWTLPDQIVIDPDLDDPDLQAVFEETLADLEVFLAEAAAEAEAEARAGDASKVIGYRRVPHPELSEGGTCGLCVVAAFRWYNRGDLKPLHARCNCEVLPITKANDPGLWVNEDDQLREAYGAINTTDGWAAKQVRFTVLADGSLMALNTRQKEGPAVTRDPNARAKAENGGGRTSPSKPTEKSYRDSTVEDRIAFFRKEIARLEKFKNPDRHIRGQLASHRAALRDLLARR